MNRLSSELDIVRNTVGDGTESIDGDITETWFDPIIVTRATGDINDKWLFTFRGDKAFRIPAAANVRQTAHRASIRGEAQ
ncbi:MAG: hypothetical protein U5K79_07310 [Cyclobacteriaceae bacterium]|nr:hypothetical protein [Cyclobacteriaceae bacterium]